MSLYKWIINTESCFLIFILIIHQQWKKNFRHIAVTVTLSIYNDNDFHQNNWTQRQSWTSISNCHMFSLSSWFISWLTMFCLRKHQLASTWKSIRLCFLRMMPLKFKNCHTLLLDFLLMWNVTSWFRNASGCWTMLDRLFVRHIELPFY